MAGRLTPACLLLMLPALTTATGWAQSLADPTRPLAEAAQASAGAPGEVASTNTGLQSIILKKQGRPAALINGVVVELGGMVGDARLVQVDEDSVVLLGPAGRETLRLTQGIEKQQKVSPGVTAKPIGLNAYRGERPEEKRR